MHDPKLTDRLIGLLLVGITVLMALADWVDLAQAADGAAVLSVLVVALLTPKVKRSRQIYVAIGCLLALLAAVSQSDSLAAIDRGLQSAAFIAAFFTALTTLRHAAETSPSIRDCGRFLATQPPGRRYIALTLGGQLFALLLNYGAITLLGSLAMNSAKTESSAEIRAIRARRMLIAIQRGFVSTLPWSPLAFSMAVTTALVPGATWSAALGPCLVSGGILAVLGWALDAIQKPTLSGPRPPRLPPVGTWSSLRPLLLLLAILIVGVTVLHNVTNIRIVGIVVVLVPTISMVWVILQDGWAGLRIRATGYATRDLLGYRGEIVLLMMAGFIGTVGAALAVPLVAQSGLDLSGIPAPVLLVALVWIIPLTGQLGMNPILSVSILAPILPHASALGVSPSVVVAAITAGWALSGASSPFTATTLMVGIFGDVSARRVGLVWNGAFTILAALMLSGWVVILATI
jgi:hypothetical protein